MAFTVQSQFWYNGDNSPPIWYKFKFLICDISCLFYATKMIKGLEHLSQGEKVREVVLLIQPKEEKAQGRILSMCINTWKEDVDKDVAKLFSVVASNRARASGHKVTCRKFYLNLRKTLFYHESGLIVQRGCEVFIHGDIKSWLDMILRNLV